MKKDTLITSATPKDVYPKSEIVLAIKETFGCNTRKAYQIFKETSVQEHNKLTFEYQNMPKSARKFS